MRDEKYPIKIPLNEMRDENPTKEVVTMAEKKNAKTELTPEQKLSGAVDNANKIIREEMNGRPYLLIVTTGYEIEKLADKSRLAAQWSWRSNVLVNSEEGAVVMNFLSDQLKDVVEHPEAGIKKKYAAAKQ